jgi:hypothetical protein
MTRIVSVGCIVIAACAWAPPATAQLGQITTCVEVSTANIGTSARRRGEGADCNRQPAILKARNQARINARDALDGTCIASATAAVRQQTCAAVGLSLPTTQSTSMARPPLPAPGRPAVNAALPIQNTTQKLCVVLRDLPNEGSTTTRPAPFCLFEGFREVVATERSRARCGVQCF